MSKNIIIQEDGIDRQFSVNKLKTNKVGGRTLLWIPEEDIKLDNKTIKENGTYIASSEGLTGWKKVTVNVKVTGINPDTGHEETHDVDKSTGNIVVQETHNLLNPSPIVKPIPRSSNGYAYREDLQGHTSAVTGSGVLTYWYVDNKTCGIIAASSYDSSILTLTGTVTHQTEDFPLLSTFSYNGKTVYYTSTIRTFAGDNPLTSIAPCCNSDQRIGSVSQSAIQAAAWLMIYGDEGIDWNPSSPSPADGGGHSDDSGGNESGGGGYSDDSGGSESGGGGNF